MGARPATKRAQWLLLVLVLLCAVAVCLWQLQLAGLSSAGSGPLDVSSPLSLHGKVVKHGPLVGLAQLRAHVGGGGTAEQLYYPTDWRARRLQGQALPPPLRLCAVAYNDEHKVILVKSAKAAGTSIIDYFPPCFVPNLHRSRAHSRCLTYLDIGNQTQLQHVLSKWDEYVVFGFARNVLTRGISQYLYLTSFMEPSCAPTWGQFCQDPYVLGDACKGHFQPDGGDACCKAPASAVHQYGHVHPQADCFVTEEGDTAVDFIGRVESFHEDFSSLIALMNEREDVPKLPPPSKLLKKNTGSKRCTPVGASSGNSTRRLLDRRPPAAVGSCDKMAFFRGPHASCYSNMVSFYDSDVRLLMSR